MFPLIVLSYVQQRKCQPPKYGPVFHTVTVPSLGIKVPPKLIANAGTTNFSDSSSLHFQSLLMVHMHVDSFHHNAHLHKTVQDLISEEI